MTQISRNSWHYKLLKTWGFPVREVSFCQYFQGVLWFSFLSAVVAAGLLVFAWWAVSAVLYYGPVGTYVAFTEGLASASFKDIVGTRLVAFWAVSLIVIMYLAVALIGIVLGWLVELFSTKDDETYVQPKEKPPGLIKQKWTSFKEKVCPTIDYVD